MGSKPRQATKRAPVKDSGPLYNPILSTNGGRHAYVCLQSRKTPLLDTSSDEFAQVISEEGFLDHIRDLALTSSCSDRWAEVYVDLGGEGD